MALPGFSQYNKWAFDIEYGVHQVNDESAITIDNTNHFGFGFRRNFNPKVGFGLTGGYDIGKLEDFNGLNIDLYYSRVNMEFYVNSFNILDLNNKYFTLLFHGGPGFSRIETSNNYGENIFNIRGGATGLVRIGNNLALKADFSTTGHISQSKTIDGSFPITNSGINSTIHNISIGVVVYLGKKKKGHADWYIPEPPRVVRTEPDTIVIKKPVINNYPVAYLPEEENNCDCEFRESIFFDNGTDSIEQHALNAIYKVYQVLNENTDFTLEVKSWSSATTDSDKDNYNLSEKRATSVINKLVKLGIDKTRMFAIPNGKDLNYSNIYVHDIARRVELVVIKND